LHYTWSDRCHDAGKELVLENPMGSDLLLFTDVQLLHQILGNLIDNVASTAAAPKNRRLWVRAYSEDRSTLRWKCEDRGPGITRARRRSIFRPFRRGHGADVTAAVSDSAWHWRLRWAHLLGGNWC